MKTPVFLKYLHSDLNRYKRSKEPVYYTILLNPGFQATAVYRFSHAFQLFLKSHRVPFRIIPYAIDSLIRRITEMITNIYIAPGATIGPGLYIPHSSGIVIGPTTIGSNCDIFQDVTIGQGGGWDQGNNRPVIGDRVYIGPGAKLFGGITIGNDASIGANAVVVKSIPERGVFYSPQGRLISLKGSFKLVEYPGMENDPDRQQSLERSQRPLTPPKTEVKEEK